jgi:hypothetical protein
VMGTTRLTRPSAPPPVPIHSNGYFLTVVPPKMARCAFVTLRCPCFLVPLPVRFPEYSFSNSISSVL